MVARRDALHLPLADHATFERLPWPPGAHEVIVTEKDAVKLVGDVYYPDDLRPGEKRAGIVLCHGYTGVKDLYLPDNARVLNEAGYIAMTFDYKGWGASAGPRTRLAPYTAMLLAALQGREADRLTLLESAINDAAAVGQGFAVQ